MPAMYLKRGAIICEQSELTGQLTLWRYTDDDGKPTTDKKGKALPTPIVVHLSRDLIEKHADKLDPIP